MKKLILIIIGASIIFYSCESLIIKDLELDDTGFEKQLAIQSLLDIGNDSVIALISENISILENEQDITYLDADVSILKEGAEFASLEKGIDGRYYHYFDDPAGMKEGEYELLVENTKYGSSRTKTIVPSKTEIKDLEFNYNVGTDPLDMSLFSEITFTILDPPGKNYYSVNLASLTGEVDTVTYEGSTDTFFIESTVYSYPTIQFDPAASIATYSDDIYINDESFDGQEYQVTLRYSLFLNGWGQDDEEKVRKLLNLQFVDHSEDSFNYITSLDRYQNSQDFGLFSEPVSVYTNIDNGLGIFAGSNKTSYLFP